MKGYEGWSFGDKLFAVALGLSIIWHLFWFSLVTVGMNPEKKIGKPKAKIVFLGPVLNDKIFRALVEKKPEFSKTFYQRLTDLASPIDIHTRTMERYSPSSVLSLPLGKKTSNTVRDLLGGVKASPEHEFIFAETE